MSKLPESELDLDLQFLPAWAQTSSSVNPYSKHSGEDAPPRRKGHRPPFSEGGQGGPRRRPENRGPRGDRDRDRGGEGRRDRGRQRFQGGRGAPRREDLPPLPELNVSLTPEKRGVESLVKQIKLTGRAYPIFDIANLILKKPERLNLKIETIRNKKGETAQELFACDLDGSLWLNESEAVAHVLSKHLDTFYKIEKIPTDPPKGTYTFVAQCGMSGRILGPPNFHDYQRKLQQLHKERFSKMPFDRFKSRVKIVRDEEVVKKWIEEQSFRSEYECLNVPEAKTLNSMEEVEAHFRETHLASIVRSVNHAVVENIDDRDRLPRQIRVMAKRAWDEQRRFPLKLVHQLSQQFAGYSLQFFKYEKSITHVAVARPRYLDLELTPVSPGIKAIVEAIQNDPKCTRRALLDALAGPAQPPAEGAAAAKPEDSEAGASEGAVPESGAAAAEPAEAKDAEAAPAASGGGVMTPLADSSEPTADQQKVITDLHWLIHQGHVIEFSTGRLALAKKPEPKPAPSKPKRRAPAEALDQKSQAAAPEGGAAADSAADKAGSAPAGDKAPPEGAVAETSASDASSQPADPEPQADSPASETPTAAPTADAENSGSASETAG